MDTNCKLCPDRVAGRDYRRALARLTDPATPLCEECADWLEHEASLEMHGLDEPPDDLW